MYRVASDASAAWQKVLFRWYFTNLSVLSAAAVLAASREWLHAPAAASAAVLLAFGAFLSFWLRKSKYEARWYSARAVSESVKTLSWRYLMCASPFEGGSPAKEAQASARFNKALHDIAAEEQAAVPKLNEITPVMQNVRQMPNAARLSLYLRDRIECERDWYQKKSRKNERAGHRYLFLAGLMQIVALAFAVVLAFVDTFPDLVGIFATISGGCLAWMQLKRCEDLSQAYKTAAKELVKVADAAFEVHSDAELCRFVLDSENAISREHTLWMAKRL